MPPDTAPLTPATLDRIEATLVLLSRVVIVDRYRRLLLPLLETIRRERSGG